MNGTGRNFMRRIALGLVMLVAIGTLAGRAEATAVTGVGDVLKSVGIPTAALCGGTTGGTAVAVVPGAKFGFTKIPVLLVTSCIESGQAKLFFLNPATSPATLVGSPISTSPSPQNGWGALTYRADQTDLLACTVTLGGAAIYSIDFVPFNNVNDGVATLLTTIANASCNGISWDISNVSNGNLQPGAVYLSPSTGASVVRVVLPSSTQLIPSGCAGSVTAMGVAGRSLFVACPPSQGNGQSSIRQLNKDPLANGALVRTFTGPTSFPRGLTADPVSFGSEFKDVLWSKDQNVAQITAAYIPGGTIGQALGAPVAFPAACPPTYPTQPDGTPLDSDGDGLLDCWEDGALWPDGLPGINFSGVWPGTRDLKLCVTNNDGVPTCASKLHKDLFVEIDWMQFHNPDVSAPNAIPNVVAAFAAAQVANPDGTTGIRLHVQRSDEIAHTDKTGLTPCSPAPVPGVDANFDVIKAANFGLLTERTSTNPPATNILNAKNYAFRYGLFVHNQTGALNTSSGCAELGGNDFMISLGSWGPFNFGDLKKPNWHNVGTLDQQASTFMHELGHTLNLRHGGGDNINCKPNYASIMNYTLQFASPLSNRPMDYSRQTLITLDKTNLNESQGVGGVPPVSGKVVFGPVAFPGGNVTVTSVTASNLAVDWNGNGVSTDLLQFPLGFDINQATDANGGCPASQGTILEGFNDWANIQYSVLASFDQAAGAKSTQEQNKKQGTLEIQLGEALDLSLDKIDFKPADPNNLFSANSAQTISVAIFSRDGDAPLDATQIDPSTLTLRGTNGFTWVVPVNQNAQGNFQCKVQDINKDGLPDFVCSFAIPKNTITVGQTKVVIDGETFTGQPVHSSDFINVN
jgi:hypothetical protein